MRLAIVAAALALACCPAAAEEIDCADPQTQTDLNLCASADFDTADRRLNAVYSSVRDRLVGEDVKRSLLRDAQRAWITFRDADCAFRASAVEGGSIQPMIAAQCRTAATQRRISDLENLLACLEGDLACPVPR